ETRRERGGGVEIIYAAGFTIRVKQFLNRVAVRRLHRQKYAPLADKKKESVSAPGSAYVSRAGERVLAIANFRYEVVSFPSNEIQRKACFDATPKPTRETRALPGRCGHAQLTPRAPVAIAGRNGPPRVNFSNPVCL